MRIIIDDTGNVDQNDSANYFGFGAILMNNVTFEALKADYLDFKKKYEIPDDFKLNFARSKEHEQQCELYKKWLHGWIRSLETLEADSGNKIYLDALVIFNVNEKMSPDKYKKLYSNQLETVKTTYPHLCIENESDNSIIYNSILLNTFIKCLVGYKFIRETVDAELEFLVDQTSMQNNFLNRNLNNLYANIRPKIEKYYQKEPLIGHELPMQFKVIFASTKEEPMLEIIHNLIYICRREEIKRRKKEEINEIDRFTTQYKGFFIRDDGFVFELFDGIEKEIAGESS